MVLCGNDTLRSCYWSEQLVAGTQISDESPTDQEHRFGDRADQAYRVQLTVSSISFGCLIFGGLTVKIYFLLTGCFSVKLHSKELSVFLLQPICAIDNIFPSDVRSV